MPRAAYAFRSAGFDVCTAPAYTLFVGPDSPGYFVPQGSSEVKAEDALHEIVGEIGLVSAGNVRTQSLEAVTRGTLLAVDYDDVRQLHFQSPEFGFYFLKLISGRLLSNLSVAEAKIAKLEKKTRKAPGKPPKKKS